MNKIGYELRSHYNGDYFYTDDFVFRHMCPNCGYRTDFQEHNPAYRQRKARRSEVLSTYDGQLIVTRAFKLFCDSGPYEAVECLGLTTDPEHFHLVVNREMEIDEVASNIKKIDPCPVCGNARSVSGALPAFLMRQKPLPDGFWRSNLVFGDGNYKFPLIFVGEETRSKMKKFGLKGLIFKEAYSNI